MTNINGGGVENTISEDGIVCLYYGNSSSSTATLYVNGNVVIQSTTSGERILVSPVKKGDIVKATYTSGGLNRISFQPYE